MSPLCIDLFAGLGGFTEGFLAESWDCVGFDIERHQYGDKKYPAQLVLQDVLTLHGRQFRDASCIVASPPCQFFSYCAMPWSRAKQLAADVRADPAKLSKELALFEACFRIQREASEAAGRHIPMVVENVQGAQAWVGPAKAHYGSFYLWGDVDQVGNRIIAGKLRFGDSVRAAMRGGKVPGLNFHEYEKTGQPGRSFQSAAVKGMSGLRGLSHPRGGGPDLGGPNDPRRFGSKSPARKAASAEIAKIPLALSRHLARSFKEEDSVS